MPELTAVHVGIIAAMLVVGAILGWIFRGDRCAKEKIAINAGWQDQIESQQSEHNRLAEQNKSLMEQISQYQASHKEATNRAKELSESLKESFVQRDELHAQAKDFRRKLEIVLAQRDRLKSESENLESRGAASASALKDKDDKIFRLSRELTTWQNRVPPLVEKYQDRERRIRSLEDELESAREELHRLEDTVKPDNTRIEPVDPDSLPEGLDASNEPHATTAEYEAATQLKYWQKTMPTCQLKPSLGSIQWVQIPMPTLLRKKNQLRIMVQTHAQQATAMIRRRPTT
jgi:uncharacterized protein (DUF3084 family)